MSDDPRVRAVKYVMVQSAVGTNRALYAEDLLAAADAAEPPRQTLARVLADPEVRQAVGNTVQDALADLTWRGKQLTTWHAGALADAVLAALAEGDTTHG